MFPISGGDRVLRYDRLARARWGEQRMPKSPILFSFFLSRLCKKRIGKESRENKLTDR
ncbi:hypothetical protein B0O99DRAFT_636799 [Bisporella sp. PMI_857]|nr:hypothetical protein B0O99DRAFT_636799 [Bisporella sp. PMI_857]